MRARSLNLIISIRICYFQYMLKVISSSSFLVAQIETAVTELLRSPDTSVVAPHVSTQSNIPAHRLDRSAACHE